ncbi:cation:proton antiporter [Natronosporangium hydrolyticum]|uniref:Cation:proton antiporter n=1 Tax=Natronosporangium hydrolyticum TaxID=2811111 RepID=A0A895YRZ2_9ACTN|nr:cation:proton antiporter [Natronosporangium hydrolyticum]QSB16880.1 cation:proton antiporter [Natronosporangium hydrolyticum]
MTSGSLTSIVVIFAVATLTPLAADQLKRWIRIPPTVLEIVLGILIGPSLLGLAHVDTIVDAFANLGLAVLFFLAGYEVDVGRIRGSPLRRAAGSWGVSLAVGLLLGAGGAMIIGGGTMAALALGLALATTAFGTILPMVRDAGLLPTPLGARIMAVGTIGEFAPIIAIAILLSGDRPLHATTLLLGFAAAAVAAMVLADRQPPAAMTRVMSGTLTGSGQFAVRLAMLAVLVMVWIAVELHLDLVIGAFAAGLVMRLVLSSISRQEAEVVESKLEGIGFGLLIPLFFVTVGVRFDLAALLGSPTALALVPIGLVGFLLARGVPVILAFRSQLPSRDVTALGLYAATALPLVVVVTDLAVSYEWLESAEAAGLVGAAMLSVLLFPLLAQLAASSITPDRE